MVFLYYAGMEEHFTWVEIEALCTELSGFTIVMGLSILYLRPLRGL